MKLGQYKGIRATKPQVKIQEQEIMNILLQKQMEHSVVYPVENRPARNGDQVILDFDGTMNGDPIPGGHSRDYPLILGSHSFVAGFEDQIVGKEVGDCFDIHVVFPRQYYMKQLREKPVVFHTQLKEIRRPDLQPIDDEFAKDFSEYDTLSKWKDNIRCQLSDSKEEAAYENLTKSLLSAVIKQSEIPIDDTLKEELAQEFYEDFVDNLDSRGLSVEKYCSQTGTDSETIFKRCEARAVRNIQEQSVLHAIAATEQLTVSEEELTEELCCIAAEEEENLTDFYDSLGEEEIEGIRDQCLMNKAMAVILENAVLS